MTSSRDGETQLDAACRLVTELDGGCLAIQGPPGAGKTYTGAHMILDLLGETGSGSASPRTATP